VPCPLRHPRKKRKKNIERLAAFILIPILILILILAQAIEYAEHPLQGKLVREVEPEADSDVPLTSQLMPGAQVVIVRM